MLRWTTLALATISLMALGFAWQVQSSPTAATDGDIVEIPAGNDVLIASVEDLTGPVPEIGAGALNATQMAINAYGQIRGFDIALNSFDGGCEAGAATVAAAAVVAEPAHLGVIGHTCSGSMAAGLPTYEAANVVTISGAATSESLPALGPTVFNRTAPIDASNFGFEAIVRNQAQYLSWEAAYVAQFTDQPVVWAEFFYDATTLLLTRIDEVATIEGDGDLVVNRTTLAAAVRNTTDFRGVTCDITLDAGGTRVADPNDLSPCEAATPTPSPTTSPTATVTPPPTSSATATPTPTPTPTATPPVGQEVVWGDNNCSGGVDPVDSLFVLRGDAGLPTNAGDCPEMGQAIVVVNSPGITGYHFWGDVDCTGAMTPVDSLKILRYDAGLSASVEDRCPEMGSAIPIVYAGPFSAAVTER